MKAIRSAPNLADQVYQAILDEICDGGLAAGTHLVQEQLAERLGVSRQPVQQAMARLKADGIVEEVGRRGLRVTHLDLREMRHRYSIRAVLDGLAARNAAERARADKQTATDIEHRGGEILGAGLAALEAGDTAAQVHHDEAFHQLVYESSGNPFLAQTAQLHWRFLRRIMGEVLRHAAPPRTVWEQHAGILDAIVAGEPELAERRAGEHIEIASERLGQSPALAATSATGVT